MTFICKNWDDYSFFFGKRFPSIHVPSYTLKKITSFLIRQYKLSTNPPPPRKGYNNLLDNICVPLSRNAWLFLAPFWVPRYILNRKSALGSCTAPHQSHCGCSCEKVQVKGRCTSINVSVPNVSFQLICGPMKNVDHYTKLACAMLKTKRKYLPTVYNMLWSSKGYVDGWKIKDTWKMSN